MDKVTLLTLVASLGLPLVPQLISLSLVRRLWRSEQSHIFALAAAGMVQVFSGLWLVRALIKLPLFFDAPLSSAYVEWAAVTLDAGPYLSVTFSLLVGWFWLMLAWRQRALKTKGTAAVAVPATVSDILGVLPLDSETPSVFVKSKSRLRKDRRKALTR